MLPPIKYRVHPKLAQIIQQKHKRRELLEAARQKQEQDRRLLKQDRKQYMQQNKRQIGKKVQQIYDHKLIKHNFVRDEERERPVRIAVKKAERLMQLIPQRRQLVEMLRDSYLQNIKNKDEVQQEKLKQIIESQLGPPPAEFRIQEKVRENNLIDSNDGTCVICLTTQAHLYMTQCRHLISCKDCQFILRMQKKCPLCRRASDYADLKVLKRKRRSSVKK